MWLEVNGVDCLKAMILFKKEKESIPSWSWLWDSKNGMISERTKTGHFIQYGKQMVVKLPEMEQPGCQPEIWLKIASWF